MYIVLYGIGIGIGIMRYELNRRPSELWNLTKLKIKFFRIEFGLEHN